MMSNSQYFKNKKVVIIGLGRSGLACANLLYDLGADVSATDNKDNAAIHINAAKLKSKNIKLEIGRHSEDFIRDKDLMVVSPGIRNDALPVVWAKQFNIPIISEIEVAWILCPATVIAVTGTNGKTTVTTLIAKLLEAKAERVFICGNIGNPFCAELHKIETGDFVVLEVSSFQLENIQTFKPKISVILNFSANHLDRYKDTQEYFQAKKRIFMNQDKSDYIVLNYADLLVRELAKETKANVVYFYETEDLNPNQAATIAVSSILGIDRQACLNVFREFKGIEHRLEYIAKINEITFINDSKATTVESTRWALKNISQPIILIAGGIDKGNDYNIILDLIREKVRAVILIGEAKKKIAEAFNGFLAIEEAFNLEEAVNKTFSKARPGDCILLSPMCSSFDMFSNYEERGKVFKQAVYNLTAKDKN